MQEKPLKSRYEQLVIGVFIIMLVAGCVSAKIQTSTTNQPSALTETPAMIVIRGPVSFNDDVKFEKEVTIYPEALITTTGNAMVTFTKRVNVIGSSQVFDEEALIQFGDGCIGTLNVCWFGAKGYDWMDDTKPFQKVLRLASGLINSVNVYIPVGKYLISDQLVLENSAGENKAINLIGEGMSSSTNNGSSMIWFGAPGESMILVRNNYFNLIQSLDFAAETNREVKHNIELRPHIYQMEFRDCSFSGSAGPGSSNINLNEGSSVQVSEISIKNCHFHGLTRDHKTWLTESAIRGGRANTKNFYFDKCSFLGYKLAAINIEVSEIVNIHNSTFSHNGTDIVCLLCNLLATANYSERSKSFFKSTESSNLAFTTLINNFFDGDPEEDYAITKGAGSLLLMNNNFGGNGGVDSTNLIRWDSRNISSIYSVGNYFRNDSTVLNPFQLSQIHPDSIDIFKSFGDKIGRDGASSKKLNY